MAPETSGRWQGYALKATSRRLGGRPPSPGMPFPAASQRWLRSEGPTACCFSFRLLLAPASTNKTANRLWCRPSLSSPSCVPEEAVRTHFGVPFTP